ncbi:hypothetical protein HK405_005223, partial [Cladochytrium tenue]
MAAAATTAVVDASCIFCKIIKGVIPCHKLESGPPVIVGAPSQPQWPQPHLPSSISATHFRIGRLFETELSLAFVSCSFDARARACSSDALIYDSGSCSEPSRPLSPATTTHPALLGHHYNALRSRTLPSRTDITALRNRIRIARYQPPEHWSRDHAEFMHELPDAYLADALPIAKKIAVALGGAPYNILQ